MPLISLSLLLNVIMRLNGLMRKEDY